MKQLVDMEPLVDITLPFPPTVNTYWRIFKNRLILSRKARLYKQEVLAHWLLSKSQRITLKCPLLAIVDLSPPDKRKRDGDNYCKGLFDSLTFSQIIEDDSQIKTHIVVMNKPVKHGECRIRLFDNRDSTVYVLPVHASIHMD